MINNIQIAAAFDFDGTITTRDALFSFLVQSFGLWTTLCKGIWLTPSFISYLFNRISRQQVKEVILTAFFKGMSQTQMQLLAQSFAFSNALKRLLRPESLRRIYWHRSQGHRLILVSAAIENYLIPWAKSIGFHDVIASRLEITLEGNITGRLNGLNCRGPEKLRRLEERIGPLNEWILYAYGDSAGDKEMLEAANFAFLYSMPQSCLNKRPK